MNNFENFYLTGFIKAAAGMLPGLGQPNTPQQSNTLPQQPQPQQPQQPGGTFVALVNQLKAQNQSQQPMPPAQSIQPVIQPGLIPPNQPGMVA